MKMAKKKRTEMKLELQIIQSYFIFINFMYILLTNRKRKKKLPRNELNKFLLLGFLLLFSFLVDLFHKNIIS